MSTVHRNKLPGRPPNRALAARRRAEILGSASKLFAEHGYAGTDLQWIADDLSLSKGTLYRYFRSKRELFFATVDQEVQELRKSVTAAAASGPNPLGMIAAAVRAYLEFFASNPDAVELLLQERASFKERDGSSIAGYRADMLERWGSMFDLLKSEGYLRPLPTEQLVDLLSHILYGTIFTNYLSDAKSRFEEQAAMIIDVLLHGAATDKARAEWVWEKQGARAK